MAKLIYSAIASLDGYINDENGTFDWAVPEPEAHAFINETEKSLGTFLLGRRMYETLVAWETLPLDDEPAEMRDFAALWHGADKIVYSTTLDTVSSARTRIEREFDPEAVRRLKETADRDLVIGGPGLGAHAIRAGLVDEYHLYLAPILVGGGTPALPDNARVPLELLDERRFPAGMVYLRYRGR